MKRTTVLLFTPPYHCGMVESAGVWMPLGLAYLSGSLKAAGYDTVIYDAMSRFDSPVETVARIVAEEPDVIGVGSYTATLPASLDVLRECREQLPSAVTVMGGVHPTFMAEEVLSDPAVDFVVRGDGERALPELLDCLTAAADPIGVAGVSYRAQSGNGHGGTNANAVVHTLDRTLCRDLDALPIDWDGLDWPLYYYRTKPGSRLAISSWSRGCTMACSFCSQQKMSRRTWRARSVDAIVAEMRMLKERFGVDTLEIADEHPTFDRERWIRILDRLIEEDLGIELLGETRADDVVRDADIIDRYREAGFLHMYVGVESPRQEHLDWMNKHLKVEESRRAIELLNGAGIITETSFLLGYPDDTPETVAETLALSRQYNPDLAFFLAITPWPYADMYAQVADRVEVHDYSKYNLINPIIKPQGMTRDELAAQLSSAFASFYMGKMRSLPSMPPHKREYLAAVAKLLMQESYLAAEVAGAMSGLQKEAAGMPPGVPAGAPAGMPAAMPADTLAHMPPAMPAEMPAAMAAAMASKMPIGMPDAMPPEMTAARRPPAARPRRRKEPREALRKTAPATPQVPVGAG